MSFKKKGKKVSINVSFSLSPGLRDAMKKRASSLDLSTSQYLRARIREDLDLHVLGDGEGPRLPR